MWFVVALVALLALSALMTLHFWWRRRYNQMQQSYNREVASLKTQQQQWAAHSVAEQQALFNSMVEGVLILDENERIRMANRTLENLFGLSGTLRGKTVMETLRVHELSALLEQVRSQGQVLGFEITLPGVEKRVIDVSAAAVVNTDGQRRGTILVLHDVTRLKKLENTRQEFVANVSHELRTPLSLIKGYVETLIDGAKDNPEVASRFLQAIERNVNRLTFLIEDLLIISKLESGATVLNFTEVELKAAVDRVIDDMVSRAKAKNIRLTNKIPEHLLANADTDRLHQVLSNLVDNAVKYGHVDGCVTCSSRMTAENEMEICVADDGPGIPPDAVERVFERFYRVDKARSREQGGTGLGLSIVKHIIQSHGGRVWATSEPGKGSSFYFTLNSSLPNELPSDPQPAFQLE